MTTLSSKRLKEMTFKKFEGKRDKERKKLLKDYEDASDRGTSTSMLRHKAIKDYKNEVDELFDDQMKDRDLVDEYGRDAPRSRSFMTEYDRPQKKAGGGKIRGVGAALGGYGKGPYSDKLI